MCETVVLTRLLTHSSASNLETIPGMCTRAHRQSLAGCSYGDLTVHLADGWTGLAEDVRVHLVNRAAPKQRAQLLVSRNGRCEGGAFARMTQRISSPHPSMASLTRRPQQDWRCHIQALVFIHWNLSSWHNNPIQRGASQTVGLMGQSCLHQQMEELPDPSTHLHLPFVTRDAELPPDLLDHFGLNSKKF